MDASFLQQLGVRPHFAQLAAPELTKAFSLYEIEEEDRRGAYALANILHESGALNYSTELWGPTPAQQRYEWRRDLGNIKAGDGSKYRGHGWLQTTGRANHARVRDRLRKRWPDVPDFEAEPTKLALPQWAALSAADYIDMRELNPVADAGLFDNYCDIINIGRPTVRVGDSNGYADRLRYLGKIEAIWRIT